MCRGAIVACSLLVCVASAFAQDDFRGIWAKAEAQIPVLQAVSLELPQQNDCPEWLCDVLRPAQEEKSAGEKLLYLAGSSLAFALFDYVGFNATRTDDNALIVYRVSQVLVQTGITYYLYKKVSPSTAIGFNLVWWTFGDDLIYYGYAELFNPGHPWESRGDFANGVMKNRATWAYWTPIGIVRGMKRNRPIAGDTLIAQALVGTALAVTVTVSF